MLLVMSFVFILLAGCTQSSSTQFLYPGLAPILIMIMLFILAFTYMGAEIFRIPSWKAYVSVELFNLVIAVLTIGFMFGAFISVKYIGYSLVGADPLISAQNFLNKIINRAVLPMYKDLLIIEAGTSLSSSFMLRVGPGVWSYVYKVEPGADAILSMTKLMSFGLLAIYASLSIQYMGLSVVDFAAPIVLSLGALLYIVPPTRDAGAFLICAAFAFETMFPLTYALNEKILYDMFGPDFGMPGPWWRGGYTLLAFLTPFASLVNFEPLIPFIIMLAKLSLITLFFPAFSILITISFISALTKLLVGKT